MQNLYLTTTMDNHYLTDIICFI